VDRYERDTGITAFGRPRISRRRFVNSAAAGGCIVQASDQRVRRSRLNRTCPLHCRCNSCGPWAIEKALRGFPVVYGRWIIEWHGLHLPLGNDALKAHAILVKDGGTVRRSCLSARLLP
jgi:hypothetical protein